MLDSNGNLTDQAKEFLTTEEIELFNALPMISATVMLERQAAAIRLMSAAMQRRALFDVEAQGKESSRQANRIAALVGIAVILQVLVEIFFK